MEREFAKQDSAWDAISFRWQKEDFQIPRCLSPFFLHTQVCVRFPIKFQRLTGIERELNVFKFLFETERRRLKYNLSLIDDVVCRWFKFHLKRELPSTVIEKENEWRRGQRSFSFIIQKENSIKVQVEERESGWWWGRAPERTPMSWKEEDGEFWEKREWSWEGRREWEREERSNRTSTIQEKSRISLWTFPSFPSVPLSLFQCPCVIRVQWLSFEGERVCLTSPSRERTVVVLSLLNSRFRISGSDSSQSPTLLLPSLWEASQQESPRRSVRQFRLERIRRFSLTKRKRRSPTLCSMLKWNVNVNFADVVVSNVYLRDKQRKGKRGEESNWQ